jgi:hypothetical protein
VKIILKFIDLAVNLLYFSFQKSYNTQCRSLSYVVFGFSCLSRNLSCCRYLRACQHLICFLYILKINWLLLFRLIIFRMILHLISSKMHLFLILSTRLRFRNIGRILVDVNRWGLAMWQIFNHPFLTSINVPQQIYLVYLKLSFIIKSFDIIFTFLNLIHGNF